MDAIMVLLRSYESFLQLHVRDSTERAWVRGSVWPAGRDATIWISSGLARNAARSRNCASFGVQ